MHHINYLKSNKSFRTSEHAQDDTELNNVLVEPLAAERIMLDNNNLCLFLLLFINYIQYIVI
jgi:hypothetical protein